MARQLWFARRVIEMRWDNRQLSPGGLAVAELAGLII
jgi:hypothetical protein